MLLTGATGFLGSHLLSNFLHRNHQIFITKRASTNLDRLFRRFGELEAWGTEKADLEKFFLTHPDIDAIVHAATDYGRNSISPASTFWANEAFPITLIELAMHYNIGLFINIDTFFNSRKGTYKHLAAYALSKRHFQEWGQYCSTTGTIEFINLRLFHLYGPGDALNKFVPDMARRCLAGDEIDLTDGEQKRDFIHINDAVAAIITVLERAPKRGLGYRHYDVGTGAPMRIRDFVETMNKLCGSKARLNFGALPTRKGEFQNTRAHAENLRALGWTPRVEIEEGIKSVIEDVGRQLSPIA